MFRVAISLCYYLRFSTVARFLSAALVPALNVRLFPRRQVHAAQPAAAPAGPQQRRRAGARFERERCHAARSAQLCDRGESAGDAHVSHRAGKHDVRCVHWGVITEPLKIRAECGVHGVLLAQCAKCVWVGSVRAGLPGGDSVPESEVLAALDTMRMRGVIDKLPNGLQTVLGLGGTGLSFGERQRLVIARTLLRLRRARAWAFACRALCDLPFHALLLLLLWGGGAASQGGVLVLDEATSAMDAEGEAQCLKLLKAECQRSGRAMVIVSHNISLVAQVVDRIVVLSEGAVVGEGPHTDLRQSCAAYREMFAADAVVTASSS